MAVNTKIVDGVIGWVKENAIEAAGWILGSLGGLWGYWEEIRNALGTSVLVPGWLMTAGMVLMGAISGAKLLDVIRERRWSPEAQYREDVLFKYLWKWKRGFEDLKPYCLKDGTEIDFVEDDREGGICGLCHRCGGRSETGPYVFESELRKRAQLILEGLLQEGEWRGASDRIKSGKQRARDGSLGTPGPEIVAKKSNEPRW